MLRSSALTIPLVTVSGRPNGLPIATTGSPTWTVSELPSVSGWISEDGAAILTTARSVESSVPTRWPGNVLPFQSLTVIEVAPATTCSLVTMSPRVS